MAALIRKDEMRHVPAPLPGWARASDARVDASDRALFAGVALAALDPIVRASAPFAGVWRQRQALRAATATVRMTGRREAQADLRDAWFLRARGAALGPAGEHLQAWRMLASNSTLSLEGLQRVALCFGLNASIPLTEIFALIEREDVNPVRAAAQTAATVTKLNPAAEFLGLWVADFVLARRLRWPQPVPLLAAKISDPAIRRAANARTSHPEDENWEKLSLSLTPNPQRPRSIWPGTWRAVPTSFSRADRGRRTPVCERAAERKLREGGGAEPGRRRADHARLRVRRSWR